MSREIKKQELEKLALELGVEITCSKDLSLLENIYYARLALERLMPDIAFYEERLESLKIKFIKYRIKDMRPHETYTVKMYESYYTKEFMRALEHRNRLKDKLVSTFPHG